MSRQVAECGTVSGYGLHRSRGQDACEPCRIAWRDYHRARRAAGYAPPPERRAPAEHGTFAASQRHRARGEELCEPCRAADRLYKAEKARQYRAAAKAKRDAFDAMLAEVWAEVSS